MEWKGQFTTVTSFSKFLALSLFVALPFLGFWLGLNYQIPEDEDIATENEAAKLEDKDQSLVSPPQPGSENYEAELAVSRSTSSQKGELEWVYRSLGSSCTQLSCLFVLDQELSQGFYQENSSLPVGSAQISGYFAQIKDDGLGGARGNARH